MTTLRLNKQQINRSSEILGNLSLVVFGTMVLPRLIGTITYTGLEFLAGILASFGCAGASLLLLKGGRR